MDRLCSLWLFLGLLAPLAGCQLISKENLAAPGGPINGSPNAASKAELPPEAAAEVCLATAEALDKHGKVGEAIALYEKARQAGCHKPIIARRLAVLYDTQGDFNRALDAFKEALQRSPKDADLLNDVGYCCYSQGKWAEAETYLRQAVAANPKHSRAWINLGMTLAQEHRYPESLDAFVKVVSPAQAQCNLGFILTTQGKLEDAKLAYRQALTHEPDLRLARGALAKLEKAGAPQTATATPAAPAAQNAEVAQEASNRPISPAQPVAAPAPVRNSQSYQLE